MSVVPRLGARCFWMGGPLFKHSVLILLVMGQHNFESCVWFRSDPSPVSGTEARGMELEDALLLVAALALVALALFVVVVPFILERRCPA